MVEFINKQFFLTFYYYFFTTRSNLELQIKLDALNNKNLSLEISKLKLKKEIRRLNFELEKIQFNNEDNNNGLILNDVSSSFVSRQ